MRVVALDFVGVAPARRNDLAAIEEGVGHRDRLIEQAARIIAQVEDVALELVGRDVGLEFLDRARRRRRRSAR